MSVTKFSCLIFRFPGIFFFSKNRAMFCVSSIIVTVLYKQHYFRIQRSSVWTHFLCIHSVLCIPVLLCYTAQLRPERQKLVRQVKITLPSLIRQKRLVWNLAPLRILFNPKNLLHQQPHCLVAQKMTRHRSASAADARPSAKINVWGTRVVSRFIRNCRSPIASARFCLCAR